MTLWLDIHDPRLRDIVGTAVAEEVAPMVHEYVPTTAEGRHEALLCEPFRTLHGAHCYEGEVLVCGWPEEHKR